jgi:hypothetical protein
LRCRCGVAGGADTADTYRGTADRQETVSRSVVCGQWVVCIRLSFYSSVFCCLGPRPSVVTEQPVVGPRLQLVEHRAECCRGLAQTVVGCYRSVLDAPPDQPGVFEVVENPRERPGVRAGRTLEFVESLLSVLEVVQDDQSPLRADLLDGLDDRADAGVLLLDAVGTSVCTRVCLIRLCVCVRG